MPNLNQRIESLESKMYSFMEDQRKANTDLMAKLEHLMKVVEALTLNRQEQIRQVYERELVDVILAEASALGVKGKEYVEYLRERNGLPPKGNDAINGKSFVKPE